MASPGLSPKRLSQTPSQILRDQRRMLSNESKGCGNYPQSGHQILHPDSSDELSERQPLLGSSIGSSPSVVTSTPYSYRYIAAVNSSDDPFQTPSRTESSIEQSFAHMNSPSMEIFLGPQPLPYVHHRHPLGADDTKAAWCPKGQSMSSLPSSKAIPVLPADSGTGFGKEDDAHGAEQPPKLSQWRQEQLKKVKTPRPVPGARECPFALLHGPLSLPYARNPSGVDATVADQSSYLSHVFGLRVANTPDKTSKMNAKARAVSDPAVRSKVTPDPSHRIRVVSDSATGRAVSDSSYVSSAGQTDPTSASRTSFGSHGRPLVVRDHNQVIGLKKDIPQYSSTIYEDAYKYPPARQSDHRSNLGLGKPQPSVPTLSSKSSQRSHSATSGRYDDAIHSASSVPWTRSEEPKQPPPAKDEFLSLTLVDPVTSSIYTVKVPNTVQANTSGNRLVCELVPTGSALSASALSSSKADASINWRAKSLATPSHHQPTSVQPSPAIISAPPPSAAGSPAPASSKADILTVEHLYEKFGHKESQPSDAKSYSIPESPVKMLAESTGRKINVPTDTQNKSAPKKKGRSSVPAGKSRSVSRAEPPSTSSSTRAKGTPGAGKHLKHPVDATPPSKATVVSPSPKSRKRSPKASGSLKINKTTA